MKDPQPLDRWAFRRAYTYGVTVALLALLALIVWRGGDDRARVAVADAAGWLLIVVACLYLLGPVAERFVRLRFGLGSADISSRPTTESKP